MTEKITHPCLKCKLPDCDDTSRFCALRRAVRLYDSARKQKKPISDELRATYSLALRELHGHQQLARAAKYRKARKSSLDIGCV